MNIPPIPVNSPGARKNYRWVVLVSVVALLLLVARVAIPLCLYRGFIVPSMSMSPTICAGDRVLATRDNYRAHEPHRFDLVVFRAPAKALFLLGEADDASHPIQYIKRIIGIPGDHIKIVADTGIYLNGKLLPEPYVQYQANYDFPCNSHGDLNSRDSDIRAQLRQYVDDQQTLLVPPGYYFVLGDYRSMSHDSHIWGLLQRGALCGKVVYRYWPPGRWGPVH